MTAVQLPRRRAQAGEWVGGPFSEQAGDSESLAASGCSESAAAVCDGSHLKFKLGCWPGPQPEGCSSEDRQAQAVTPASPGREPDPEAVTLLPELSSGHHRAVPVTGTLG